MNQPKKTKKWQVICTISGTHFNELVEAHFLNSSSNGFYYFVSESFDAEGNRSLNTVAQYPISRTVIKLFAE